MGGSRFIGAKVRTIIIAADADLIYIEKDNDCSLCTVSEVAIQTEIVDSFGIMRS